MAGPIIHFGSDPCCRIPVLQSAGFDVDLCSSLDLLIATLERQAAEAVVVSHKREVNLATVIATARSLSAAPLILFENAEVVFDVRDFDLVIPKLTSPSEWLTKVRTLIAASKLIRDESQKLRAESLALRIESAGVRRRHAAEARRAQELIKKPYL